MKFCTNMEIFADFCKLIFKSLIFKFFIFGFRILKSIKHKKRK